MTKETGAIRQEVRNIAIVAHVDHGKTTLVEQLFRQTGLVADTQDRSMDSGDIERERGITILAKQTGISYDGHIINIIDTPGHADFGGEVERTLQMVEGFLLLVDAAEGVLPGTRFVLSKAFERGLRPIVLINKVDRKDADIERTRELINDLFLDLATDESQLDFQILYGSAKLGFVTTDPGKLEGDMKPLFEAIIKEVPPPRALAPHLQLLVTNLDHSEFLGPIAVGRVFSGSLRVGQEIVCCKEAAVSRRMRITKLFTFLGLKKVEQESVSFGDIVAVTGFDPAPELGATLCEPEHPDPCPYVQVDEPTLSMYFSVNNSPFSGKEGSFLTARHLRDRLFKELRINLALRVEETGSPETFKVSGRGQLHLGILIENMRREGFELQVSAPEVIYKTIDGKKHEPIERIIIDVPSEYQGVIMENLGPRKGEMQSMDPLDSGRVRLEYLIPSRGLLGFRGQFLTSTRGTGMLSMTLDGYEPFKGNIPSRLKGALISMEQGETTGYALDGLQPRGILFVKPGDRVYEGMIIGEHSRENDLDVNPCKMKKLTNMRASGSDDAIKLMPPRVMELEVCMEWIRPDELIEVTPQNIRLRKKALRASMRKRSS